MSLDAPVCPKLSPPTSLHWKDLSSSIACLPASPIPHRGPVPCEPAPPAVLPTVYPYSLLSFLPQFPPPRGLTAHPGLQPSACGAAGHAGSGCPLRCHCHCEAFLPPVGVSGSRAGCWLLACSVCSCSTWSQRTGPGSGGEGPHRPGTSGICALMCGGRGPSRPPPSRATRPPMVLFPLHLRPPLACTGSTVLADWVSGLGAHRKGSTNVRTMNGAPSDFSGIPLFPVYPAKLLPHVCGDMHQDFLCYY